MANSDETDFEIRRCARAIAKELAGKGEELKADETAKMLVKELRKLVDTLKRLG